jgi:excisionase family DNA binding protein
MKAYLNAAEIAKLLNVDRATVTRWAQKGHLKGAIRLKGLAGAFVQKPTVLTYTFGLRNSMKPSFS